MSRTGTYWWMRSMGAGLAAALLAGTSWSQVPDVAEPLKNQAQSATDQVKPGARGVRDAVRGAAGQARDAVKGAGAAAKDAAEDARREGGEALRAGAREGRQALRAGRESVENLRAADLGLWIDARAGAEGLVINDVAAEGAIAKVGFQEGDRIVSINDTPVRSEQEFVRLLLADDLRNERVRVVVFRGGREQILYVQPALIYQEVVVYDPLWQYGIVIDDRYPDRIVILRVYPRTPAYYAGLRAGDVITTIGGQRITTVADFTSMLSSAEGSVALQVNRANRTRQIALDASAVTQGRARTTLRPEIGAEGAAEGRTARRPEGGRVEGRIEGKAKGRVEKEPAKEGEDDIPTPRPRLEKEPKGPAPRVEIPDLPEPAPAAPKTPKAPAAPKLPGLPKL